MKHFMFLLVLVLVSCGKSGVNYQPSKEGGETPPPVTEEKPNTGPAIGELEELAKLSVTNGSIVAKYFQEVQPGILIYKSEMTPQSDLLDFLSQAQDLIARLGGREFPAGSVAVTQVAVLHTTLSRAKDTVRFPYRVESAAANNALYLLEAAKPYEALMILECGSNEVRGLVPCLSQVMKLMEQRDRGALTSFANTAHKFYEILRAAHEEFGKQAFFDPIGNKMRIRHKLIFLIDAASTAAQEVGLNYQFPILRAND